MLNSEQRWSCYQKHAWRISSPSQLRPIHSLRQLSRLFFESPEILISSGRSFYRPITASWSLDQLFIIIGASPLKKSSFDVFLNQFSSIMAERFGLLFFPHYFLWFLRNLWYFQIFKIDKLSGKISYVLSARDLSITWSDQRHYWSWSHRSDSRSFFKDPSFVWNK